MISRWAIILLYPADFNPVCISELSKISDHKSEFDKRNCKVLVLNSKFSEEFPYPIIAESTGFFSEDGEGRSTFIISPDHKVHISMFYPMSTGRNVDEILRSIDSIQLTERLKVVATPSNWYPGMKVMILPEVPDEEAQRLFPGAVSTVTLPSGATYIRTTNKY